MTNGSPVRPNETQPHVRESASMVLPLVLSGLDFSS